MSDAGFHPQHSLLSPKQDPSEEELRGEIETLVSLRYPKYGYRRITKLLLRMGYTVGYKRVARLMRVSANLSVAVKRVCQTTNSIEGVRPYVNRLENVEISRCDQTGWAILPMSDLRRGSSMFACSWMSSRA